MDTLQPQIQTAERHPTVPIRESITPVPGYPKKLVIYRQKASSYWWVRYYDRGKIYKKTTKARDKRTAFKFAAEFYERLIARLRTSTDKAEVSSFELYAQAFLKAHSALFGAGTQVGTPNPALGMPHQVLSGSAETSFEACAQAFLKSQAGQLARGEITPNTHINARYRLTGTVLPYFANYDVRAINYAVLDDFLQKLSARIPKLSGSTVAGYMKLVRSVLTQAHRMGVLDHLPAFPRMRTEDNPRGYFTPVELRRLWSRARAMTGKTYDYRVVSDKAGVEEGVYVLSGTGAEGRQLRRVKITADLHQLIMFMVNSFVRPTDIRNMQHKHVDVVRADHTYLRLRLPR